MKNPTGKKAHILFLILPHSNLLDFAGAAQVFQEAIEQGLEAEISFCAYEANITTSVDLPLGRISSYKNTKPSAGDYIFIVSANMSYVLSGGLNPGKSFLSWLENAHTNGAKICAICNAAFLVGDAGLLDNRQCTTHWKRTLELQQKFPFAKVQQNMLFVEDENIITSAGMASGIDVALYILSKIKNDYFVYRVSRELVLHSRRDASHSIFLNYRSHVHAGIHKVQDWLMDNLHKKTSIGRLAEIALMSERNFTRVFKKETQLTVNEYITALRMERIKTLLQNPDLSREQIARSCGLQSARQVNRLASKIPLGPAG